MKVSNELIVNEKIFIITFCILLLSCSSDKQVVFSTKNKEMHLKLTEKLKSEKINFNNEYDYKIGISIRNREIVHKYYKKIFNEILPPERSFSLTYLLHNEVENSLNKNGYKFHNVCFDKYEYIVLDDKDYKDAANHVDMIIPEIIYKLETNASLSGKENKLDERVRCKH